jgi:hypothetical protein
MSINIIDKKFNKRKKKKRNEMDLEDYAKKNNLNLDFSFSFGNSPEKAKKLDYFSNSYGSPKFDDSDSNINLMKQNSSSTNNTSIDDENKEKEKKEKQKTKNKFENNFSNEVKEFNLDNNFYNNINNNKNDLYAYSNPNFSNFPKINKKLFTGIKEYYTDIDEKNINNINNIDKNHAKIIMGNYRNYQNALFCNYISNMNFMNMKIYNYNYNIYKLSLNACLQNIKEIEKNLEKTKTDIKNLESTTLQEMILLSQTDKLIPYFTKKTNIPNLESNNIKNSTILKHPYFYQNHNEEIEVNFILYLIEGLFLEENLIKDYILVSLLDRDGYVSLIQLEKHPQISKFKISLERLNEVFKEHRQNEVTETVETFDEILIRNKDWKNIKKKGKLLPSDKIKQNLLNEMGIIKHNKMKKLMGKKSELTQIQDKLYFRYHVLTQNVKQIQSHFSTINNFYNCQTSNFIFNNNNYNIYNNYNGNQRKTDY